MTFSDSPTPGWYADPQNASQLRYWDGATWTEAVAPVDSGEQEFQLAPQSASLAGAVSVPGPAHGLGDVGAFLSSMVSVLIGRAAQVAGLLVGVPLAGWLVALVLTRAFVSGFSYDRRTNEFTGFQPGTLIAIIVVVVLTLMLSGVGWLGANHQLHRAHLGQPESFGQSLRFGLRRLPRAVGWGCLYLLAVLAIVTILTVPVVVLTVWLGYIGLLSLLLIVPLALVGVVFLLVKMAFWGVAVAVGPGGMNPFGATWQLSRGRYWPMFLRLFVLMAIVYGISFVFQIFLQIGVTVLPSVTGFGVDQGSNELLIDGQSLSQLDVLNFESLIPNVFVMGVVMAFYLATQAATQALWAAGLTALYQRGGGPCDLDVGQ